MPTSPNQLFRKVGCTRTGSRPWGTKPDTHEPGVYIVSLHANPSEKAGLPRAPIGESMVADWIERAASLTLNHRRPMPRTLKQELSRYWLSDEAIVYIGKATSLHERVGDFYSTRLGNRGPHAGGRWLHALTNLKSLTVHYAALQSAKDAQAMENRMLHLFSQAVSAQTRSVHPQPDLTIPFANLEMKPVRRNHRIGFPAVRK